MSDYLAGKSVRTLHKGIRVVTDNVPFTDASTALFNIVGGKVLVKQILGTVTTAVEDDAITMRLQVDPDVGGAAFLCAATSIRDDAAGTIYGIVELDATTDLDDGIAALAAAEEEIVMPAGVINAVRSAARTGAIRWEIFYVPIDDGAYIEAA